MAKARTLADAIAAAIENAQDEAMIDATIENLLGIACVRLGATSEKTAIVLTKEIWEKELHFPHLGLHIHSDRETANDRSYSVWVEKKDDETTNHDDSRPN